MMEKDINPLIAMEWLEWKDGQRRSWNYISLICSATAIIFAFIMPPISIIAAISAGLSVWKAHDIMLPLRERWLEIGGWRRR